ncbi:MAG: ATP-binding protein, partial [Oscillospiraceae bacterium]|nr:ATP-binding protein [Oscillospiraceae bacterium]
EHTDERYAPAEIKPLPEDISQPPQIEYPQPDDGIPDDYQEDEPPPAVIPEDAGPAEAEYPGETKAAVQPAVVQPAVVQPAAEPDISIPDAEENPAVMTIPRDLGQSLQSFYDSMDESDILYRDCVEVWAADAKPSMLRLLKYIEGIEDKRTQGLFGRECEYVNAMIDRVFCFTQLEYIDDMMEPKRYNFAALVKECLRRFSPFFMEKRLGLLWKGLDTEVVIDRRWFIFALTQVVFNSVEFTDEGGKIAISATRSGDFVELTVEDSGRGIPPEEIPFVFAAGYMGDEVPNPEGRRTGMGLFIARSIVRKMGGDVTAESELGKGTRVVMRLPAGV